MLLELELELEIYISACITFFKMQFYMSAANTRCSYSDDCTLFSCGRAKEKNPFVAVCSPLPLVLQLLFIFACVELSLKY